MNSTFNGKLIGCNISSRIILVFVSLLFLSTSLFAVDIGNKTYISTEKQLNSFALSAAGSSTQLVASSQDYPGVIRVLKLLQKDIANVTNAKPELVLIDSGNDKLPSAKEIVIVGTIGKSSVIDKLIKNGKLDVNGIKGKWETFLIQVIDNPLPNIDRALVIAGSDKRGTIYGMFDLSSKMGVSPWYYWADVPVEKHSELYILPGRYTQGEPKVKYRGIFLNDEAPALSGWGEEKFGTQMFNHEFYDHVFELILRLKGNFLWPAMWGRAFYDDDSVNPKLADEYGIVISTSHHEPMMRAHDEWRRYGSGPWNYSKNEAKLREFWRKGIERMGSNESIVTLAMRGDGDEAMSPDANVGLLEKIVKDQREILSEVTGKDASDIPQVWALYKEVQEYYDKGMRVPDDVTVFLCDDNWGNVRKLPKLSEKPRKGGYGMYYHFDYVGGPRNYKWLNTNQIEKVWEQMHLSYEYGVRQIWLVNVGDLKPMEFPIEFFLDYAWNPERFPADSLPVYTKRWAEKQFGGKYSNEIAELLSGYTKFNSRRKPEMLSPETYSLVDYKEAETIVKDYNKLADKAERIYNSLPAEYKDAFYQLVLHSVTASANLNELYVTTGMNRLYAEQGRASANSLAEKVKSLYLKDSLISHYYNKILANGKWSHMMDQTHIGYTNWQQPNFNSMPKVQTIELPKTAEMGVAIEGSTKWWSSAKDDALLPEFDPYNKQSYHIDIFNRGTKPFDYSVQAGESWIQIDQKYGIVETEKRLFVSVDWKKAPAGKSKIPITINGADNNVIVYTVVNNPVSPKPEEVTGHIESNGYVSIEAVNYSKAVKSSEVSWQIIPNLGKTGSALSYMPVTIDNLTPGGDSPHLEYKFYLFTEGNIKIDVYLSPTINFNNSQGLRYAVSIDDEKPVIVNMNEGETVPDWKYPQWWNQSVSNNIKIKTSEHTIKKSGEHTLKFWAVDPGVVLQKILIKTGEVKPSYLGPSESFFGKGKRESASK